MIISESRGLHHRDASRSPSSHWAARAIAIPLVAQLSCRGSGIGHSPRPVSRLDFEANPLIPLASEILGKSGLFPPADKPGVDTRLQGNAQWIHRPCGGGVLESDRGQENELWNTPDRMSSTLSAIRI
jgi:hypothetical protein